MASTVFANGMAVATTKSGHIAHSTEPDMRLVDNKVPTPLLNYLETENLLAKLPEYTEFDGAKIWTTPSELGAPSKPVDTWPGVKNGGAKNAKIMSAKGQGSVNVYVEANQVLCHTHLTDQNKGAVGNSAGIIDDEAGWDAYKKKFEAEHAPGLPKKPKPGGEKVAHGTTTGKPKKPGEKKAPSKKTEEEKEKELDCTLEAVEMKHGKREASGSAEDDQGRIEVVPGLVNSIHLKAEIKKHCGDHPKWSESGRALSWSPSGEAVEFYLTPRAADWVDPTLENFNKLATVPPWQYVLTCKGHQGVKNRTVDVYPTGLSKATKPLFNLSAEGMVFGKIKEKFEGKLTSLLGKVPGLKNGRPEVEICSGNLELSMGWQNAGEKEGADDPEPWQAFCEGKLEGTITLLAVTIDWTFKFEDWPIPEPTVKTIQLFVKCLNEIWDEVFGHPLLVIGPFIRLKGEISVKASLAKRKFPAGEAVWKGDFGGSGSLVLDLGFHGICGDKVIAAEAFLEVGIGVEAKRAPGKATVSVQVTGKFPPIKLVASFSWDFGKIIGPGKDASWWEKFKNGALKAGLGAVGIKVTGGKSYEVPLTGAADIELFKAVVFK